MNVRPIFQKEAFAFVELFHRHHKKPVGSIFQVSVVDEVGFCVGVAIVGRPVSRMLQDGKTCEVTRLCTDGTKNACSMLYSACARIAKEMGYKKIITYILSSEKGTTLRAAGWEYIGERGGGSWSRPSRGRDDKHPVELKKLYSKDLNKIHK
jgi:hypothetical protein